MLQSIKKYLHISILFCTFAPAKAKMFDMGNKMINKINSYFATQPIAKVWLFGSFARGEQRRNSDIDLLVQFDKDAHVGFRYAGMVCELEDLLHRKVDMVVDGNVLSFAQDNVNRDKKLIYERAK